jgi:hypothetical protein
MIFLLAGILREPDVHDRGPDDVDKWKSIVEDLQELLDRNHQLQTDNDRAPVLAFQLSVRSMGMEEKQLLAVLRHFPPVQEVSVAVIKAVWQGVWAAKHAALFETALMKLQRMNVVDIHHRQYYGFHYGAQLSF